MAEEETLMNCSSKEMGAEKDLFYVTNTAEKEKM